DRADELVALNQRNARAGANHSVERQEINEVALLKTCLEGLCVTPERSRSVRLVLGDLNRRKLRPVHALERNQVAARVEERDVELPITLLGLGHGRSNRGLSAFEGYRGPIGHVERDLVWHRIEWIRRRRLLRNAGRGP